MTFEKVSEFYKRAVEEKRFSEDFLAEAKSISSEDKLKKFFAEKVLPIAQNMGYDFTADDLIAYERQVVRELSEEELENITGGISLRGISTAFMSLLMITSNIQPMSNAMLSRNVIIESANLLTGKSTATDPQKNPIDGRKNSVADVYTRTSDEQQASADLQASKIQRLLEVSRADYVTLEGSEDDEVASGSSEKRAIVSDESESNATKDHKLTKYGYDYVAKLIRESEATKGSSPINMLRSICYEKKYSDFYAMRHYSNSTE